MRITLDRSVDAAYIYLVPTIAPGGVAYSADVSDELPGPGAFVLDFDKENRLLGIEVLGARLALPEELLEQAQIIG